MDNIVLVSKVRYALDHFDSVVLTSLGGGLSDSVVVPAGDVMFPGKCSEFASLDASLNNGSTCIRFVCFEWLGLSPERKTEAVTLRLPAGSADAAAAPSAMGSESACGQTLASLRAWGVQLVLCDHPIEDKVRFHLAVARITVVSMSLCNMRCFILFWYRNRLIRYLRSTLHNSPCDSAVVFFTTNTTLFLSM